MRRTLGLAITALLALTLLAAPAVADDASAAAADNGAGEIVLAVDGPAGPEPMERNDPDNKARELAGFEDPDVPFTYYAAFLLAFAGFVGLALLVGLYYLLVQRPSRETSGTS